MTSAIPIPRWRQRLVDVGFVAIVVFVWTRSGSAGAPEAPVGRFTDIAFQEVSAEVGINFKHVGLSVDPLVANIAPQITATGAAVAVVDADGDGWPDLYVTSSGDSSSNALYRNLGDGTFEDVAEQAGLADLNHMGEGCSMGSVWADFDGDGDQDAFVYKWGYSQLFRNLGNLRFEDVTEGAQLRRWMNSNAATWFDFDRDGLLDLYVTGYYAEEHDLWDLETTVLMHDSFEFARNGGRNFLYRNRGDGTFEDITEEAGASSPRWTYAVVAADFDHDGWTDLYLANDYGTEELLFNREGRRLEVGEGLGLERESKSGMCVALGNQYNDGRSSIFVTNISRPGYLFQGNNLRINRIADGHGLLQDAEPPVTNCGWAWGAQFGDLDNDGWQDLVVANGFISASRERDYWYQMSKIGIGSGVVVEDAANWPTMGDRSLSGYERTQVLFNRGNGRYVEAGRQVGIDDEFDGRAIAMVDLERDGDLDVVSANQRGPLLVYRNESKTAGHWIAIELEGSGGNRDALGAEVRVHSEVGTQVQVVAAFSGFSAQNDRRLHFGLGPFDAACAVEVRWPSGEHERWETLAVDRAHRLLEGAVQ